MRQLSPSDPSQKASLFVNGQKGAVVPVSALKMLKAGTKRRRGEGRNLGQENGQEEAIHGPMCLANNPDFRLLPGISELSGPAGVGKTQLALSLCADCVCSGNDKAVFVQLGGSSYVLQIASRRIQQMLQSRFGHEHVQDIGAKVHDALTRVLVHWVCNPEELVEMLQRSLPRLLKQHPEISVVILDGIANLFRLVDEPLGTVNKNPWHDRAVTFFQISSLCKKVSSEFKIPFLVLNECTSRIDSRTEQTVLEPALGLAWAQCVNASFFVRRDSRTSNQADQSDDKKKKPEEVCHRIVQCLRAPHISTENSVARFWIDRSGTVLV